ncbi:helix-turn-helix domain-containing protein [Scytonema sp. NUACC26]|uniref:helix-turn-helix domain-containing protein n=1 Tax=Scytonema sp. NUACC26 TaxID=3140176 RepID=UPI0034DBACC3
MKLDLPKSLDTVLPTEEEVAIAQASYEKLAKHLQNPQANRTITLMQSDTEQTFAIPESAFCQLIEILAQMARGNAVKLHPIRHEVEIYEAADILGVSNAYVMGLLESGKIPYRMEGTSRRMRCQDVLDYKKRNDEERRKILDELAAEAQELNMGY